MSDHFSETTSTSYMQNIGNSLKGVLFGFLFFIISIVLLYWNEGRSVDQANALKQMQESIQIITPELIDTQNNGKAVLIYGSVKPTSIVKDSAFGISSNALALARESSTYQWQENKHSESKEEMGGSTTTTTTYDYEKVWTSQNIDSGSFKHREGHENISNRYPSQRFLSNANMGKYHLNKNIISNFDNAQNMDLHMYPSTINNAKNTGSYLYIGEDEQNPRIGDVKLHYKMTPAGEYTLAASVLGQDIVSFATDYERSFVFVRVGHSSADKIFKEEFSSNNMFTWVLRGVGLLVMFIGLSMIMGPLGVLANVLPFFGSMVGLATGLIAFLLTLVIGSIVIVLAWIGARPLVLVGVIVGVIALLVYLGKRKPKAQTDTSSTPPPRTPPPRRED